MDEKSKVELEALIKSAKTIGTFTFDEVDEQFTSDVEIVLILNAMSDGTFRSVSYFFDGYEVAVDPDDEIVFEGPDDVAIAAAIVSWNSEPEYFEGYPVIHTNVSCEIA